MKTFLVDERKKKLTFIYIKSERSTNNKNNRIYSYYSMLEYESNIDINWYYSKNITDGHTIWLRKMWIINHWQWRIWRRHRKRAIESGKKNKKHMLFFFLFSFFLWVNRNNEIEEMENIEWNAYYISDIHYFHFICVCIYGFHALKNL